MFNDDSVNDAMLILIRNLITENLELKQEVKSLKASEKISKSNLESHKADASRAKFMINDKFEVYNDQDAGHSIA